MAKYKRERRVYKLIFDDPEFEGLEIRVRSIPIRELRGLMALDPEDEDRQARAEAITKLMYSFSEALVGWNMEGDSGPIPATLESVEAEDTDFVLMIITQWLKVISSVGDGSPLPASSTSGKPSLVESIPMEALSPNPAS